MDGWPWSFLEFEMCNQVGRTDFQRKDVDTGKGTCGRVNHTDAATHRSFSHQAHTDAATHRSFSHQAHIDVDTPVESERIGNDGILKASVPPKDYQMCCMTALQR